MFEDALGESWSAYTDHNPVEVRLAKGWIYRAPPRTPRRLRRPDWVALRGSSDGAVTARAALATELDWRVTEDKPATWSEVVSLGVGVARAVLGEEPVQDHRPWVKGLEHELSTHDQAVSGAYTRKRQADSLEELRESLAEIRRCKRRRSAWLRAKEVEWWDDKARALGRYRTKPTKVILLGLFLLLRNCVTGVCLSLWVRFVQRMSNQSEMLGLSTSG